MTDRIKEISRNSILPISIGLLVSVFATLSIGVWGLAIRVTEWEVRLDSFEAKLGARWSYYMERESWSEFTKMNPGMKAPDTKAIKEDYGQVFR